VRNKLDELFSLEGYIAVVTGGMGQLSIEYSCALIERGARVAIFDIANVPKTNDKRFLKGLDGQQISPFTVDVTKREEIVSATQKVVKSFGVPNILINNAALDSPPDAPPEEVGPFEEFPESSFDKIMNVNVKGTFLCCQVIGKIMAEKERGSIINISSIYGLLSPRQDIYDFRRKTGETFFKPAAYSVSKSAVLNMTRYLATYWAKKNVRVNTLTLGGVFNNQPDEFLEQYCKHVPLGRMADAREYVGAVVFLASEASSYITGSNLIIDGGWTAW